MHLARHAHFHFGAKMHFKTETFFSPHMCFLAANMILKEYLIGHFFLKERPLYVSGKFSANDTTSYHLLDDYVME